MHRQTKIKFRLLLRVIDAEKNHWDAENQGSVHLGMCVCVCIHTYIHTYTYICIYVHIFLIHETQFSVHRWSVHEILNGSRLIFEFFIKFWNILSKFCPTWIHECIDRDTVQLFLTMVLKRKKERKRGGTCISNKKYSILWLLYFKSVHCSDLELTP